MREQTLALSDRVLEMQMAALEAQQRETELVERCGKLEDKLARAEDWEAQRARYMLKTLDHGAAVYVQKPSLDTAETPHWLCANCFENRKKSHLQPQQSDSAFEERAWNCPRCRATITAPQGAAPQGE